MLGTDSSSLLCCHLMHLSVLPTILKLATEPPASQVSACLSTGDWWLFTLLPFVKACAAVFTTSGCSDRQEGEKAFPLPYCFVKESEKNEYSRP